MRVVKPARVELRRNGDDENDVEVVVTITAKQAKLSHDAAALTLWPAGTRAPKRDAAIKQEIEKQMLADLLSLTFFEALEDVNLAPPTQEPQFTHDGFRPGERFVYRARFVDDQARPVVFRGLDVDAPPPSTPPDARDALLLENAKRALLAKNHVPIPKSIRDAAAQDFKGIVSGLARRLGFALPARDPVVEAEARAHTADVLRLRVIAEKIFERDDVALPPGPESIEDKAARVVLAHARLVDVLH